MAGFTELVEFVVNGERVNAGVAGRATRAIDGNTRYLRDVVDTILTGQTIVARCKIVNATVKEGQPVFFSPVTQQFEPALGQVTADATTNLLVTAPSAQVWGIVLTKVNATKADILLHGVADVDMSEAIAETVPTPGLYYLSNAQAGKLTPTRQPVGVNVLQVAGPGDVVGTTEVYVNTKFLDFLESHRHVKFKLVALPSGTITDPGPGGTHVITASDSSIEGWLPATDDIFEGNAPAGAKFGYNISASKLATIYPPVPVENSVLQMYRRSVNGESRFPLEGQVPDTLVTIDANGIWWLSDCYDEVPWPTDLDATAPTSITLSESVCPVDVEDVSINFWYTNTTFSNNDQAVLSIRGKENSGIIIRCAGTSTVKSVGHLEVDLDLDMLVSSLTTPGHIVIKQIMDDKFLAGPVIESVKSISPELIVTSDVDVQSDGSFVGNINIAANLDVNGAEFPIATLRLNGVEEEFFKDVMALGFSASRASEFRGSVSVPTRLVLPTDTQMKLRFWVMGRVAGSLTAAIFTLTRRIISRPTVVLTDEVALPLVDVALAMTTTATFGAANEYIEMESAVFDVVAGDEILFTMQRAAPDGYSGELHVLRRDGVLVAGSS